MRIVFTKHAETDKFKELSDHNFPLKKTQVIDVIKNPEHEDTISDAPKIIASKNLDDKHILRVVYKYEHGIIKVVTFYPSEKGRYY